MALSNWDTMAWDTNGKPCIGEVNIQNRITIEIYKNWVHLFDSKVNSEYPVLYINSGDFEYNPPQFKGTLEIKARRGFQNSVYLFVKYCNSNKPKDLIYFFGIGASGYRRSKWVGVSPSTEKDFNKWIYKHEPEYECVERKISKNYSELIDGKRTGRFYNIDGRLPEDNFPILEKGLRYNDGDKYFAEHGLVDGIHSTESGKQMAPIAEVLIKNLENNN
jgi:hypothetical protein